MKKLSRVLAVILALALCLPGMAAAEMTEAEKLAEMVANVVLPTPELPLVDEPMTITVKYPKTSNHGDFDNCFYLKAVEKLTNIKLDVQGIDANGWDEKLALDFVSGDYSEIYLNGVSFNDAAVYGQAGMLRPLEDLLEQYAPNAVEILNLLPEPRRNVTASDGHIYMMAAYDGTPRDMLMNATYNQEVCPDLVPSRRAQRQHRQNRPDADGHSQHGQQRAHRRGKNVAEAELPLVAPFHCFGASLTGQPGVRRLSSGFRITLLPSSSSGTCTICPAQSGSSSA